MEFSEKLQNLRKSRGWTQQELADKLYVSRTAVSKWESGKGYPNIDSLKSLAALFSVSVDELLSGGEILAIAESDGKARAENTCGLIFGLLDVAALMLAFLPLYGKADGDVIRAVTLLGSPDASGGLIAAFFCRSRRAVGFGRCGNRGQVCGRQKVRADSERRFRRVPHRDDTAFRARPATVRHRADLRAVRAENRAYN